MNKLSQTLRYKNYVHFHYESRKEIWFGPLKQATDALINVKVADPTEETYLEFLKENFPDIFSSLEHVSFYSFKPGVKYLKDLPSNFEYHIAVTYQKPNPITRKQLYDTREIIASETGWYPLSMGSKAITSIPLDYFDKKPGRNEQRNFNNVDIGEIQKVTDVSGDHGGNSFLLEGSQGTILFDSGFDLYPDLLGDLKAICLSHFHKDHSGGIWNAVTDTEAPILTSEPSFRFLWEKAEREPGLRKKLLKSTFCIEKIGGNQNTLPGIGYFPVFHAPGSYGFYYQDRQENCLIYPGDICIKNGFLDSRNQLIQTIDSIKAREKWIFVDCSMIGKGEYSIDDEDSPGRVLSGLAIGTNKKITAFVSQSPETLIYSLVLAFTVSNNSGEIEKTNLVVNHDLLKLSQSLLGPMLIHDYQRVDPFVLSVMGKAIKNFAESYRVYTTSAIANFQDNERIALFITPSDISSSAEIQARLRNSNIILAGRLALDEEIPQSILSTNPRSILRISSPDWSFHSSEEDLLNLINILTEKRIKTILFHNNQEILADFIYKNRLNQRYVNVVTPDGVNLR